MLFEQQPYFVQRRYRASGYRRPCSSNVSSASRVGTLPSFFTAGRRLYGSWTVLQCWCSTSTVDSFSFLIFAFVCHAYPYPAFVLEKSKVCGSFHFRICFHSCFCSCAQTLVINSSSTGCDARRIWLLLSPIPIRDSALSLPSFLPRAHFVQAGGVRVVVLA